jgi:hypothetical protein
MALERRPQSGARLSEMASASNISSSLVFAEYSAATSLCGSQYNVHQLMIADRTKFNSYLLLYYLNFAGLAGQWNSGCTNIFR